MRAARRDIVGFVSGISQSCAVDGAPGRSSLPAEIILHDDFRE